MNTQNCQCREDSQAQLPARHRDAWRNAVASLVSPIVRLHELRNVRTQMLHHALQDVDCGEQRKPHA